MSTRTARPTTKETTHTRSASSPSPTRTSTRFSLATIDTQATKRHKLSTSASPVTISTQLVSSSSRSHWKKPNRSRTTFTAVSTASEGHSDVTTASNRLRPTLPPTRALGAPPARAVGIAVGLSIAAVVLLALIIIVFIILCRKKQRSEPENQPVRDLPLTQTAALSGDSSGNEYQAPVGASDYEEISDPDVIAPQTSADAAVNNDQLGTTSEQPSAPAAIYATPHKPAAAATSPSAPAAEAPVYSDTATTLVDNTLYDAQPSVTPSNVADNYESLKDASTPIYAKPYGPAAAASTAASVPVINTAADGSSSYNDTATTLVDNSLYDAQPSVTPANVAETDDDDNDLTLVDNDLYVREGQTEGH